MNRRFLITPGTIGAFALFIAGTTVDLHAQRGIGAGHASVPTNTGQGRPTTAAGRPDTAGRPAGTGAKANTNTGKPESTGRPTMAEQLTRDHGLGSQLQKLFPADTDLVAASKNFKNLGSFVAAAHVADNNPNFTFEELTAKMFDGDGMTLGQAIHALDPKADVESEVETAQTQAAADVKAARQRK
jgi:hypothetical protein